MANSNARFRARLPFVMVCMKHDLLPTYREGVGRHNLLNAPKQKARCSNENGIGDFFTVTSNKVVNCTVLDCDEGGDERDLSTLTIVTVGRTRKYIIVIHRHHFSEWPKCSLCTGAYCINAV